MGKASELIVRIGANSDEYSKELQKVGKQTKSLEENLAKIGKISGVAFAAGTAAIFTATKAAGQFEDKFTNVVTLLDKASFSTGSLEDGIDGLKKGVIELGQETGESFDTLNTSLFNLISAGVPAEEAIDTLRVTTNLAAAGATDTATAVNALNAVMTSFGEEAGTAQEISEKFFTAQKFGVTTVGELATEFNKVAGIANNLGVSFDETLASLSALTANGTTPTNVAATQLKATMTSIINVQKNLSGETEAVQKAMSLQNLETNGLVAVLDDLKAATGNNIPEMTRLLGSAESLSVALSLTGAQSELVKKQIREMADEEKRAATYAEALSVKQENSKKAFERLSRVVETAAIVIGDQFAPVLAKAAELLGEFFKILVNNPVLSKTAALFLGLGTALAGIATAGALAATAFLKIRAAMIALNVSTRVLALGLKGLVGATGLGLLLIIASEIYNNWSTIWPAVVKIFSATVKAISNLGAGLGKILKGIFSLDSSAISEGIDQAKNAISQGLDDIIDAVKGKEIPPVEVPVTAVPGEDVDAPKAKKAKEEKTSSKGTDDFKKNEQEKTEILDDEQKKRIAANQQALAIMNAENKGATAEEIDLIRRKNDLEIAEKEAMKEKSAAVRASEMELINAEKEQLLADEKAFLDRKAEQEQISREEKAALDTEFKELSVEEQATFNEADLETMQENILTRTEIEDATAAAKLEKQINARNKFLQDEMAHGTTVAKMNKILGSDTVKTTKQTADSLVQLSQSKNDALKGIGKAAAATQIGIDSARGAMAAYTSLAGIPIVGPALGFAAAGALVAFGVEKTAAVLAANTGGMVPRNMGTPGTDSVNALLTPGELVVPEKNFDEVVGAVAANRGGETATEETGGSGELDLTITLEPTGDLMDMIEQKIIQRKVQGVGLL